MVTDLNISFIVWTDIDRDGAMSGINIEGLLKMIRESKLPVIASGGVTNISDLIYLKNNLNDSLAGVICGRALYEGAISIDIIKLIENN